MSLDFLKRDEDVKEDGDNLGGTSFIVESGADEYEIEIAYLGQSQGGANSLTVHLKNKNALIKETFWITSGTAKGGHNYYLDKKTGEKRDLPGFAQANALAQLTTGKPMDKLTVEERVIKKYDFDAGKELPVTVNAFTEMSGQTVIAGIIKKIVNKEKKGDDGNYYPTNESREFNEVDKFFCTKEGKRGLTLTEILGGVEETDDKKFLNRWEKKWTGVTVDKFDPNAGGATQGAPAGAADSPSESLFG